MKLTRKVLSELPSSAHVMDRYQHSSTELAIVLALLLASLKKLTATA